jgi:clan AA aspartic protease
MMTGVVKALEAHIKLRIRGSGGKEQRIDVVIDSGFTGCLTLPPQVIASLGLKWQGFLPGILADGSQVLFDAYVATVVWDRRARQIVVHEADSNPLLGMALLSGYEFTMQVRHRGKVTIKRLP